MILVFNPIQGQKITWLFIVIVSTLLKVQRSKKIIRSSIFGSILGPDMIYWIIFHNKYAILFSM